MSHAKAKPRYDESKRNLRISYVPEKQSFGSYSTREWVQQFSRRLELLKIATVNEEKIDGFHRNDNRHSNRDNACYTDFLVIFTVDYAEEPPQQLDDVIQIRESVEMLMWLLKLDPDDFRQTDFGGYCWWHQLIGTEYQERFKRLGIEGWDDEQTRAAELIKKHPNCGRHSPVCPNHQPEKSVSSRFTFRWPKLFGRRDS